MKSRQRHVKNGNVYRPAIEKQLDDLSEYEEFKATILPAIQKALLEGASAKDIYKKFAPLAAARTVSIVAKEVDSGKALAAAKDIMDRAEGKAAEKITHTHHYENLSDDELDAQIVSRAEEAVTRAEGSESQSSGRDPETLN